MIFLIEAAFHKYAIADKKYNRYLKGSWKGEQGKIALALFDAHLDFDIMHRSKNLRTIPLGEISQSYQNGVISKNKAIDLFRKYKNKKL